MARPIEKQLSKLLRECNLNFIPLGTIHIENIYELVKQNYPELCDDDFFCFEAHRSGNRQTEWKHVVRSVMQSLKKKNNNILKVPGRGNWQFI